MQSNLFLEKAIHLQIYLLHNHHQLAGVDLIGHKLSQYQAFSGHFVNKQLKIIQLLFRFQGNLSTK